MYDDELANAVAAELRRFVSEEEYDQIGVQAFDHGTAMEIYACRNGREKSIRLHDLSDTGLKLATEALYRWFRKRELN